MLLKILPELPKPSRTPGKNAQNLRFRTLHIPYVSLLKGPIGGDFFSPSTVGSPITYGPCPKSALQDPAHTVPEKRTLHR